MSSENQSIGVEEKTYPLLIDYLPDEYCRKAEIELNETPENYTSALEELISMARDDEETKDINFHEDFLRQFLRQSKYDVHRSMKRLQAFTKFRRDHDIIFKNVEDVSKTPDYQYITALPWRCRDGCTITISEYSKWDPSGISLEDLLRLTLITSQQSLRNPLAQINGIKIIVDWKDSRLNQLKYTSPKFLFMAYKATMVCTPARNKEIHIVNESPIFRIIWALFKPFLPDKLKKRVYLHSAPEDLLNHFPKHALPVQYGGDIEDYYMGDWIKEANEQQRISTICGQCNSF